MKSLDEVEAEFRSQILIPKNKPLRQFFFCPTGYIGSGKTTITKMVSEKFNLIRISNDDLRFILKENGHDYSTLKDTVIKIAEEFVQQGFSIAFDMNCANPITKNKVDEFSCKLGIPTIWVHINPPEKFIINNIKLRNNIRIFGETQRALDNYFYQKQSFAQNMMDIKYAYTIDPSKSNFNDQIIGLYSIIENLQST